MKRPMWLSTEDVARELGFVQPRWVRRQIDAGRLRATVIATGERVTYRIARRDLEEFCKTYLHDSRDRDWLDR